jgi:hypothetical protein
MISSLQEFPPKHTSHFFCILHVPPISSSSLYPKNVRWRIQSTRVVWKVRGLALLLRVGTLWRCSDDLFFKVHPLASDALLTMLHSLLKNVLQTIGHFEISCLEAPFSWLEKPRNHMGWDLDYMVYVLMGFHWSTFSKPKTEFNSDLTPLQFLGFSRKGSSKERNFEVINSLQHIFKKGWNVVKNALLGKRGTLKKRLSLHLHKVLTPINKVSQWTLQTALVWSSSLYNFSSPQWLLSESVLGYVEHISSCLCWWWLLVKKHKYPKEENRSSIFIRG